VEYIFELVNPDFYGFDLRQSAHHLVIRFLGLLYQLLELFDADIIVLVKALTQLMNQGPSF
jgi:hypothetical protein